MTLTIGSLFSGIGGLELGLERAGLGPILWQVELSLYCRQVLAKHWPHAERHMYVQQVGRHNLAPVDVICGGFPCQDISAAGKGAGLTGKRSGLWFEMLRIIEELRPSAVVAENVGALRTRGLDIVCAGLDSANYDVRVFQLHAADLELPHLRRRLFITGTRRDVADADREGQSQPEGSLADFGRRARDSGVASRGDVADTLRGSIRVEPRRGSGTRGAGPAIVGYDRKARRRRTLSGMDGDADGLSRGVDRVASRGYAFPALPGQPQFDYEPSRVAQGISEHEARLTALGNAVVPQCAETIGYALRELLGIDKVPHLHMATSLFDLLERRSA